MLNQRLFEGCRALQECVCPKANQILSWCFCGCESLKTFDFQTVCQIGPYAFEGCNSLTEASFTDQTILHAYAMKDCGRLETISLLGPKGEICLREYALSGCTALKQVKWQEKVWSFTSCGQLFSGSLPDQAGLIFQSAMSCFTIQQETILCKYESAGQRVCIPYGITHVEAEAFRDKMMLEEIQIPDTVKYIGARAFHNTKWIKRKQQQSPMVIINHMLLDASGCIGDLLIPEDLQMVCGWAFANGIGIQKIRFQSSKTKVEEYAFRNCIHLKEIQLSDGKVFSIGHITDRDRSLPPLAKQAVMDSLNCFKTAPDLTLLQCTGNISELSVADGITAIGDQVFLDANLLTKITLPTSVKAIGKLAFSGCKWLKTVEGGQGITLLGERAFAGCCCLEHIPLPQTLCQLGASAFENCTSLQEITLPEGVEEIPPRAFFRCHSLRHVHLPSTIRRIGPEAFAFCRELKELLVPPDAAIGERAFAGCNSISLETNKESPEEPSCATEN